jgi:hypothetical protein
MPDFGDLEEVAKSHSEQVTEGLEKAQTEGDKLADGRDHGMIDKGVDAAEKRLGEQQDGAAPPSE